MIIYLATREHAYTIRTFLELWGKGLAGRFTVMAYADLLRGKDIKKGTYIFADIERLNPVWTKKMTGAWEELSKAGNGINMLNHPARSMRRYELLKTLYEEGINAFNIYRVRERRLPSRFPVFIRGEHDHIGTLTSLLHNPKELTVMTKEIIRRKISLDDKVIIEFCDTSDSGGIFKKYSAYIIGERIIPQHVMFGSKWMLKGIEDLADTDSEISEEQAYVENNPHEAQLREIFRLAGIRYGRIDYSMLNGKPQVWEINTNPTLMRTDAKSEKRKRVRMQFVQQVISAFEEIDSGPDKQVHSPAMIDDSLF